MRYSVQKLGDLISVVDNMEFIRTPYRTNLRECLKSSFTIKIISKNNGLTPSFEFNNLNTLKQEFPEEFI